MTIRLSVLLGLLGAVLALAPSVQADAVYHSQHYALMPVGDAPLRSGFVENIHANGPRVYAHELYSLSGATPATEYDVTLLLYVSDPTCSGAAIPVPSVTLTTNPAGNALGMNTFDVATVDGFGIRHATHGIVWEVTGTNGDEYTTGCKAVTLD